MEESDSRHRELQTIRDTVESVWVAIVLAFVLRAFVIEAFVIPTGSMAPRLMGEHWDLICPQCGYHYAYGWNTPGKQPDRAEKKPPAQARCPSCGAPYCGVRGSECAEYVNCGDRVLVLKYLYPFKPPQHWDVIVFRNPENNRENFIKRLIGLPGETVEIVHGDVFHKSDQTGGKWEVLRKPQAAQDELWQIVFDNDYQPDPDWLHRGEAEGITPYWRTGSHDDAWTIASTGHAAQATRQGRVFTFNGLQDWADLRLDASAGVFLPRYGYNASTELSAQSSSDIITDLKLSLVFVPKESDSAVRLSLTSFEHKFVADVQADGSAILRYFPDRADDRNVAWQARLDKPLEPGKGYRLALAHADFQAKLLIDGAEVLSTDDSAYSGDYAAMKTFMDNHDVPVPEVGIAARGGRSELWHVSLMRDVFYTYMSLSAIDPGPGGDYARNGDYMRAKKAEGQLSPNAPRTVSGPGWAVRGNPITLARHPDNPDLDEFFVLGDNSPLSKDGRAWTSAAPSLRLWDSQGNPLYTLGTVPRYLLVGRAMFVYWPSGFRPPGLGGLPLIPNVGKMRFIR